MSLKDQLKKSFQERYAMGAFNFYNLESLKSITKSADIKEKPVFAMVSEKAIEYAGLEEIIELTKAVKLKTKVDIYLHLDHGKDIELVKRCIKMGFDSVMFDGSALPIDQNIIISKDLCRIAHRNGVVFEAEIGRVGGKEDKVSSAIFKTDPRDAQKFFEEVKPDMLAVAIGNVHGPITANEELDFTLLAKIQDTIKAPLVLHGCSNRLPREYKVAISQGIVKINIDTELRQAFVRGVSTAIKKKISDPREILTIASDEMSEDIKEKIEIFSCEKLNC